MTAVFENGTPPLLQRAMSRAVQHLIPFKSTIEYTYHCNLKCRHCYIDAPTGNELSVSEWKGVLSQLASAGSLYLLITGGEALVRSDFFQMADYARKQGFVIMLLTNGTLIDPIVARHFTKLRPIFVGISLYGASESTHDEVTGTAGSFRATTRAVTLLLDSGTPVALQATLMDLNVHEAPAMKELADSMGVHLRLGLDLLPTKTGALTPQCYGVGLDALCHYVEPDWVRIPSDRPNRSGLCKAGRGTCSISPTGDVFPCALMPLKVGNLRNENFSEIWRNNPAQELKYLRSLTQEDFRDCSECSISAYCMRCMGTNLSETGQLTKPAPTSCHYAKLRSQLPSNRKEA